MKRKLVRTLEFCQSCAKGGFGGNYRQLPHLATTYSALCVLLEIDCLNMIELDKVAILKWIISLKQVDGSFTMHEGGESDIRGTYCALAVCHILNIICPQILDNCESYINSYSLSFNADVNHTKEVILAFLLEKRMEDIPIAL